MPIENDSLEKTPENPNDAESLISEEASTPTLEQKKLDTTKQLLEEEMGVIDEIKQSKTHATLYNLCYRTLPELKEVLNGNQEATFLNMHYEKGLVHIIPDGGEASRICGTFQQMCEESPIGDLFDIEIVQKDTDSTEEPQSPHRLKFTKKKAREIVEQQKEEQEIDRRTTLEVLEKFYKSEAIEKARDYLTYLGSPEGKLTGTISVKEASRINRVIKNSEPLSNVLGKEPIDPIEREGLEIAFITKVFIEPLDEMEEKGKIKSITKGPNKPAYTKREILKRTIEYIRLGGALNTISRKFPIEKAFSRLNGDLNSREGAQRMRQLLRTG